jgi:CBS domain-containing protein
MALTTRSAQTTQATTEIPVREFMTREVTTVPPTMPVREFAALLHRRRISGAPVVDEAGHVLGVASEFDVIGRQGATVGDIMSRQVISVTEETGAEELAHLFVNERIRRVPVLAEGRLVGIVSRSDLVRPTVIPHVLPGDHNDICMETDQA